MWLLSTDRAELHRFVRNFDAIGGYAILSHTWDGEEQSFWEVQAIGELCLLNKSNPRDHPNLSAKIRECCILAEQHGYRWLWIDSCCIDKTSSSELSEAINSMYQWYKEAEVCYVYLADVPDDDDDDDLDAPDSAFRTSRWHTRGWTLQELIAPDFLIFLSADWHELGNRAALAGLLQEITGVPFGVLTGEHMPAEYSISIRMFWASKRKTTRVEDEAYCLMGLFGVSMPTNYGEGKKAFTRLQYEIMQHDSDMSLFAFGGVVNGDVVDNHHGRPQELPGHYWKYLMADSPHEFGYESVYIPDLGTNARQQYPPPLDSAVTGPFDAVELPSATVTSYGIQCRLPVHEADGITIAVILCQGSGRHLGLFLTRDSKGKDPKKRRFFTGCVYQRPSMTGSQLRAATYVARIADLGDNLHSLTFNGKPLNALWQTIYIVPTASGLDFGSSTTPNLVVNCNPISPFRIPRWLIARFTALQFEVYQVRNTETLQGFGILHRHDANIIVLLGLCGATALLWATVYIAFDFNLDTLKVTHDCSKDHIHSESWATRSKDHTDSEPSATRSKDHIDSESSATRTRSKVFGDANRGVRLSFTPSTRTLEDSDILVIHLELFGHVFEPMLQAAAISFPSLADLEKARPRGRAQPKDSLTSSYLRSPAWFLPIASLTPSPSSTREPRARPYSILPPVRNRSLGARVVQDQVADGRISRPGSSAARLGGESLQGTGVGAHGDPSSCAGAGWEGAGDPYSGPPHEARRRENETEQLQGDAEQGNPQPSLVSSGRRVAGGTANEGRTYAGTSTLTRFPWPGAGRPPLGPWSSSRPPPPPPGPLPNPPSFFCLSLLVMSWMTGELGTQVGAGCESTDVE